MSGRRCGEAEVFRGVQVVADGSFGQTGVADEGGHCGEGVASGGIGRVLRAPGDGSDADGRTSAVPAALEPSGVGLGYKGRRRGACLAGPRRGCCCGIDPTFGWSCSVADVPLRVRRYAGTTAVGVTYALVDVFQTS
jgi:hypothetical protein